MGWLFTPTLAHTDGGVDGFIEIRRNETDELTNVRARDLWSLPWHQNYNAAPNLVFPDWMN